MEGSMERKRRGSMNEDIERGTLLSKGTIRRWWYAAFPGGPEMRDREVEGREEETLTIIP